MADVEIDVVAGCCKLRFHMGTSTGEGADTNPGVGFEAVSSYLPRHADKDGKYWFGMGVIGRKDAARLRDELEIFLKQPELAQ